MRFVLGSPPSSESTIGPSWNALREPGPWVMQALAFPIGATFAFAILYGWARLAPKPSVAFEGLFKVLVVVALLIAVHEALHALAHPSFGLSRRSTVGFWPSRVLFYAHYEDCLPRNRFIFILLLPTLVLSFLPLLLASALNIKSGWLLFIACSNALLAGGDILGVLLLMVQVPASATVQNEGYKTYWLHASKA